MRDSFLQFLGIAKKSGKLIEGYNNCEETIKSKKVKLIIISIDSSENTKNKFKNYCESKNVFLIQAYSKEELGKCIGRTEINILCVVDSKISENLINIWKNKSNKIFGGDAIV
jgi:ribosomal protein L7Ae-like RNA K-turn-binding protein